MKEKEIQFIIKGELPTLNEYINAERSNKFHAASIKKQTTDDLTWEIKSQRLPQVCVKSNFVFQWYCKNSRKDPDNIIFGQKFIFDALQKAQILQNDNMKWVGDICHLFFIDKNDPRVVVTMIEA